MSNGRQELEGQLASALAWELQREINATQVGTEPFSLLCSAFQRVSHLPGKAMAAVVSVTADQLQVASVGHVGVFVVRSEGLVGSSLPEDHLNRNFFDPPHLHAGSSLGKVQLTGVQVRLGDLVIIATDGVLYNMHRSVLASKAWNGDRLDSNRAKMMVGIASQLSLGVSPTPFSDAALQLGFEWRGGRPDDASTIVLGIAKTYQ
jgi:hypothetical protein